MIRKLFDVGCFDYQKFIFANLKSLSLDNDEAVVLIKLINNYENNKSFSPELIASSINEKRENVEKALSNLLERGFYEIFIDYNNGLGEESITIDGFFSKCKLILDSKQSDNKDELFLVNQLIQKKLNRLLTSNEMDIVASLVNDDRYLLTDFEQAIKGLEDKKKNITIRQIAGALSKSNKPAVERVAPQQNPSVIKDFFKTIK